MPLAKNLIEAAGNATQANYIEDVFSTYLYNGTGSAQTITNGVDLSTKGGLVWMKKRNGAVGHALYDTARGVGYELATNSTTESSSVPQGVTAFTTTGFSLGTDSRVNASSATQVSWTFRKQPKFFDVVTWTGNASSRTISHSLGSVPACIMVKNTSAVGDWVVYHRSLSTPQSSYMKLNTTDAVATGNTYIWDNTAPTSTVFSVGASGFTNNTGENYVAYIFAHDAGGFGLTGTDNVISCGSFTTNGSGQATVNLGYEPQWLMIKNTTGTGDNWIMQDVMRSWPDAGSTTPNNNTASKRLFANLSDAETQYGNSQPSATGFFASGLDTTKNYIYIAIRRGPMKVPTDATKVFAPVTRTGDGVVTTNFPVDLSISTANQTTAGKYWDSRLTMGLLQSESTAAESAFTGLSFASNTSTTSTGFWGTTLATLWYSMRRAPSFFDEVCYTGTGSATTQTHNLGVVPELMIIKRRTTSDGAGFWAVYSAATGATKFLTLNAISAENTNSTFWNDTAPTSSVFTVGTITRVNGSGETYVAYLFATCAGVSKVFNYTGNGSSQTINCGFTGGARWIMIKRTDSTGDWYVWDTARGIVSGNDPHLSLNTTAAEVTSDDTIDTDSTGFIVNQLSATNVNVTSATYIGIAIA